MIPTMLILGFVLGRLWAIPAGAVLWGMLLVVTGVLGLVAFPEAAAVGGANVAVGVIARRLLAWPLRWGAPHT